MKLMDEANAIYAEVEKELRNTTNPTARALLRTQLSILDVEKQIILLDERLETVEKMLGVEDKRDTVVN